MSSLDPVECSGEAEDACERYGGLLIAKDNFRISEEPAGSELLWHTSYILDPAKECAPQPKF